MKIIKKLYLFLIFLYVSQNVMAVSAYPYPFLFTQPNGDTLTIILKGDEYVKYAVTLDGYTLLRDNNGFFVYAQTNEDNELVPSQYMAKSSAQRTVEEKQFLANISKGLTFNEFQWTAFRNIRNVVSDQKSGEKAFPTVGRQKLLCILMEFPDRPFIKTKEQFHNLFNQVGYNDEVANGSVRDYFLECSYGNFDLDVDVVGPYTARYNTAYYGGNTASREPDSAVNKLIEEAVIAADKEINFSDYDNDGNKEVDAVYVIFAGYGEENGSCSDCIWSHSWFIDVTLQGYKIREYACSPELRGNTPNTGITHIGVICHEFGHVLGAPDYYDTNYGGYEGTGRWDLQAEGSWNDGGRTPAHPNPRTKIYTYKWASVTVLENPQTVILPPSTNYSNVFYRINTKTTNEHFIIENKVQTGFDKFIPGEGMLIYRTASNINNWSVNANHPQRFYPVAANCNYLLPTGSGTYGEINSPTCTWPNLGKTEFSDTTSPSMRAWSQAYTEKPITNITKHSNGFITFDFMGGGNRPSYPILFPTIFGVTVTSKDGSLSPVDAGGNYAFTVSFSEKYDNSPLTVRVNGKDTLTPVDGVYTLTNVMEPKVVEFLNLTVKTFPITATAGENGTISPAGVFNIPYLSGKSYIISPNSGYMIEDVQVDGESIGAVNFYTFYDVTAPHTISATFQVGGLPNIIHTDPSSMSFVSTFLTPSVSQVIKVSAEKSLEDDIDVKTQLPFQVSRTGNTAWNTTTRILKTELPRDLYIRFFPSSSGNFSGELQFIGRGVLTIVQLIGDATNIVDEIPVENGISLFPNPAAERVTVKMNNQFLDSQKIPINCTVFNILGEAIHYFIISDDETIINTSDYKSGVYFIRFLFENKSTVIKLVISK